MSPLSSLTSKISRRTFLQSLALLSGGYWLESWIDKWRLVFGQDQLTPTMTLDLLRLLNRPLQNNVLKLFRAVPDPVRNRIFVSGIMTPHIGIWDSGTQSWSGTVNSGIMGNALKYLAFDTSANRLYVRDDSSQKLLAIDVAVDKILATIDVPSTLGEMKSDPDRGFLYLVSSESPNFRVLDGQTLQSVFTTSEMGDSVIDMQLDSAQATLHILSAFEKRIYQFNLDTLSLNSYLQLDFSPQMNPRDFVYDATTQQFFVVIPNLALFTFDQQGKERHAIPLNREADYQDFLYDPASQHLVILSVERPRDGRVAGVTASAAIYEPMGNRPIRELTFGRKVHSMVLNTADGSIYCPNGDASTLWVISPDQQVVNPIRLGDSVEQLIPALNGKLLLINSRLGGSYITVYDVEAQTYTQFETGIWPIPMRINQAGNRLFVLNAWESTLSIVDLSSGLPIIQDKIAFGIPAGSTDRLPDLAIDETRSLAFAAYAEFAQVAVINWQTKQPVTLLSIEGIEVGDTAGGGPGQLQLAVNADSGLLFVYLFRSNDLQVYDLNNNFALINLLQVPRPRSMSPFDLLFIDLAQNRLFIGEHELDATTGQPTRRSLAGGQRLFAIDSRTNIYWASAVEAVNGVNMNVVYRLDRSTLQVNQRYVISESFTVAPQFALDETRGNLYIAYMPEAKVDIYFV